MFEASDFKARYKEFKDSEDLDITVQIEECKTLLNAQKYGAKYKQALFLLVAHELYLSVNLSHEAGVVVSRGIEGGSVSLMNLSKNNKELYYSKTAYGSKFLVLKGSIRVAGIVLCESMQG